MISCEEKWRREIHGYLRLAPWPVPFPKVGKYVPRPPGVTKKLIHVVGGDPRFVLTVSGTSWTLANAESDLARPAASTTPYCDLDRFLSGSGYAVDGAVPRRDGGAQLRIGDDGTLGDRAGREGRDRSELERRREDGPGRGVARGDERVDVECTTRLSSEEQPRGRKRSRSRSRSPARERIGREGGGRGGGKKAVSDTAGSDGRTKPAGGRELSCWLNSQLALCCSFPALLRLVQDVAQFDRVHVAESLQLVHKLRRQRGEQSLGAEEKELVKALMHRFAELAGEYGSLDVRRALTVAHECGVVARPESQGP